MKQKSTLIRSFMVIVAVFSFAFGANAQTVTVMNTNDDGMGSLRQAVLDVPAEGTIVFDAATNFDAIVLTTPIVINKSLTITGNGEEQTVLDGNGETRIFEITNAEDVTIQDIYLTNGYIADNGGGIMSTDSNVALNNITITMCEAIGSNVGEGGGAIYTSGGMMTVTNGTLTENTASGTLGSGGAVLVGPNGMFTAAATTISENTASRAGGGIEGNSGENTTITLNNVILSLNDAGINPGNGGGLHITGAGDTVINGGEITGNTAAIQGGGLWNGTGTMTVTNATVSNNTASGDAVSDGGGGIYNFGGTLDINNNTMIMNNTADGTSGSGGGIFNNTNGAVTITASVITNNTANRAGGGIEDNSGAMGSIEMSNTEISENDASGMPGNGGGLHVSGAGTITIVNGSITSNTASEGGGLWNGTGLMTVNGTTISENTATGADVGQGGGGIYNHNGGTLNVLNATISNNDANGASGSGGGILNSVGSSITVENSEISGNTAERAGGGIEDNSGSGAVTLNNVMLTGNSALSAPGNGGGLHVTGAGTIMITGGEVSDNTATLEGGGLWNGLGTMTITNTDIEENTASGDASNQGGGGIYNLGGTLNITGATISGNIADGTSASGGGILSLEGEITISDTDIMENSANRAGGAIELVDGTLTVNDSQLMENDVNGGAGMPNPGNGGALHITGIATVVFNAGMINNNEAASEGGGLWNQTDSNMTLNGVTLDGNSASGDLMDNGGGAIYNNGGVLNVKSSTISNNMADGNFGRGGGIHIGGGTANIMHTTISGNMSGGVGGGINNAAELNVNTSTIAFNTATAGGGISNSSATAPTLRSTIVSNNIVTIAGAELYTEGAVGAMIVSEGYNLIASDGASAFTIDTPTDLVGTIDNPLDPGLLPLADNGGETMTHKLDCPSIAADMGDPTDMSDDQLGLTVFNGRRDIGAYEAQEECATAAAENFTTNSVSVIYPNPSVNGIFTIDLAANHNNGADIKVYEIATGKLVKELKAENMNMEVQMNGYATGTYILQIVSDNATESHKVIIAN